jgi:hypothetical protein
VLPAKARVYSFLLSLFLFVGSLVISYTYRPYIYSHHIYDLHLADSFSDLFAVPATLFWGIATNKDFGKYTIGFHIMIICIFLILYEFLISAITDVYDMIAVIVSGVFTWLILRLAMKKYKHKLEKL